MQNHAPTEPVKTPEQVKELFQKKGHTFTLWAKENGYRLNEVYRVINGQSKGKYGKAHEIAVKLGLKSEAAKESA